MPKICRRRYRFDKINMFRSWPWHRIYRAIASHQVKTKQIIKNQTRNFRQFFFISYQNASKKYRFFYVSLIDIQMDRTLVKWLLLDQLYTLEMKTIWNETFNVKYWVEEKKMVSKFHYNCDELWMCDRLRKQKQETKKRLKGKNINTVIWKKKFLFQKIWSKWVISTIFAYAEITLADTIWNVLNHLY